MRILISTVALVACTSLASAADLGGPYGGSLKDEPIAAAPFSWTGLYIGAHAGWATGGWDGRTTYTDPQVGVMPEIWDNPNQDINADGWLGGAQMGFNFQRGSIVFGIEADVSWADLEDEGSFTTNLDPESNTWDIKTKVDAFGTVRGRLGYLVSPRLLIYGTGGLAWAKTSADLVGTLNWNGQPLMVTARGSADETHIGWTAGLGGEMMVADNWTLKAEWLHVDLGKEDYQLTDTDSFPADLSFDVFRVGVNYKFGR